MSDRRFNPKNLAKLDSPERKKMLPVDDILSSLMVDTNDTIADLGSGTGYFTIPVATKTTSTVYAVDIEPQMLHVLQERLTEHRIHNVDLVKGPIENVPLSDQSVDKVIASMVLHEVEPLLKGIQEIKRILKPGGRCLCVEWEKITSDQGPPLNHRIHSRQLKRAIKQEGFQIIQFFYPSQSVYVVTFEK